MPAACRSEVCAAPRGADGVARKASVMRSARRASSDEAVFALLLLVVVVVTEALGSLVDGHGHQERVARPWPPSSSSSSLTRRDDDAAAAAAARRRRQNDDGNVHLHQDDPGVDGDDNDATATRLIWSNAVHQGVSVRPPMLKASLTQMGYIQFLRYVADVPHLPELSFCVWMRSRNLTHSHPIFSYSKNEKERLARAFVSPPSPPGRGAPHGLPPRLHMHILERAVFIEPLPEAGRRRWLHVCCSWDGRTGDYHLYVDGRPRRAGVRHEVAGLTLPGGGDVVVGQEYTDFDKGLDDGVEGDIFGFYLFRTATPRKPLSEAEDAEQHQFLLAARADDDDVAGSPSTKTTRLHRRRGDSTTTAWRHPHNHHALSPVSTATRLRRRPADRLDDDGLEGDEDDRPATLRRRSASVRRYGLGPPRGPPGPPGPPPQRVPARVQRLYAHCEDPLAPEDRADAVVSWPSTPVRVFGGAILSNVNGGCGDF